MTSAFDSIDDLRRALESRAPEIAEDPRVYPALRIGGIGHRKIEGEKIGPVSEAAAGILAKVKRAAELALAQPHAAEAYRGPLELFAITPLAEGSDRIVSSAALNAGYKLGAILPFAASDYENTFDLLPDKTPAIAKFRELLAQSALPHGYGVLVLDGAATDDDRTIAYRECGSVVAQWSDILIAILASDRWGSETGLTVREAIRSGVTTIVIDPHAPQRIRMAMNGAELPANTDIDAELDRCVWRLLGVAERDDGKRRQHGLAMFHDERVTCDTQRPCDFEYSGPYRVRTVARGWISWCAPWNKAVAKRLRPRENALAKADEKNGEPVFPWQLAFDANTAAPFAQLFLRQHRADVVATAYAELHRSAQLVTGLLGLLAAALAVTGFLFVPPPAGNSFVALMPSYAISLGELLCLVFALAIVRTASDQRWLERWVNCRLIAEVLRYAKYLMVSGRTMSFADFGRTADAATAEHSWTFNYCRNVLRGMRIAMPGRSHPPKQGALQSVSAYLANPCIEGQIVYHRRTAGLRSAVALLLQRIAFAVAAVTVVCVAIKLVSLPFATSSKLMEAIDGAAVFLPAIAGALLGFRGYGEHGVVGRRSRALVTALEQSKKRIATAASVSELGEAASSATSLLLREVDGWLELFSDKRIEL